MTLKSNLETYLSCDSRQLTRKQNDLLSDLERAVGLIEEMKKQIDSALGNTKDEIRRQFDMDPPQDIDGPVCCATVLLAEEHLMGALTHYKSIMGD